MAILYDSFSYRINTIEEGQYYDRWHGHVFPEFSMPEKLYFLNSLISILLTHDKLLLRTDSIEEFIDCLGFKAFRLLYDREELIILDNWWFPAFMYNGDKIMFMNMHKKQYQDEVCKRLFKREGLEVSSYIKNVFKKECNNTDSDIYDFWDHLAHDNMYDDFVNNNLIRASLEINSDNPLIIKNEQDTLSTVRLCLFERSLEWARQLSTDEIIFEEESKKYLVFKSNCTDSQNVINNLNKILKAKGIPNLSLLYYNGVITIQDIIRVRDEIAFGKFTLWLKDNNYNYETLIEVLIQDKPRDNKIEKWIRWGLISAVPFLFSPALQPTVGIGAGLIDQLLPQFSSQKIPALYFDKILANQFNGKKLYKKLNKKLNNIEESL